MNIDGKKVLIIGAGRSGVAAALLVKKNGGSVIVADRKEEDQLGEGARILKENGIEIKGGNNYLDDVLSYDTVILSPGVHLDETAKTEIKQRGIELISELEFAYWFVHIPILAITGTNGKSTTTALIGHIIGGAGYKVFVGGNIGNPLSNLSLTETKYDCAVVEVSSFMLEDIERFCPQITIFTNISQDHLDRYKSYKEYKSAKLNILKNLNDRSPVVINSDCEELVSMLNGYNILKKYFSKAPKGESSAYAISNDKSKKICILQGSNVESIEYNNPYLVGEHNLENILAASLATALFGVSLNDIQNGINSFSGLPHRIEFVREIDGVKFYNDSKATNVDSALVALRSFDSNIIWIAGGRHKGTPYSILKDVVRSRVKRLIAIGEAAELIYNDLKDYTDVEIVRGDLREAVLKAFSVAKGGDSILLSPACSSYDMFLNYEERGDVFKEIVRGLK